MRQEVDGGILWLDLCTYLAGGKVRATWAWTAWREASRRLVVVAREAMVGAGSGLVLLLLRGYIPTLQHEYGQEG